MPAHPDELSALVEALDASRQAIDPVALAQALDALAYAERRLGRLDDAMKHYGEAAGKYREAGVALKVAHTVRHRGDIYRDQNRPDLAEPCYNEALEIYRAHKEAPLLDVANCIRGLALLKDEAGELDHAKLLWEEAGSLYAVEHVQAGVEECSRRLAAMAHRRAQNG